jgi:hypothetical protein
VHVRFSRDARVATCASHQERTCTCVSAPGCQEAGLTVDILKSGTLMVGMIVRLK